MAGLLTFVAWFIITCVMMEKCEDQRAVSWMCAGILAALPTSIVGSILEMIIG